MRHRKGKLKRQHGIIKGLVDFLERNVTPQDYVDGVIPGEIRVGKATGENLKVSYKYGTITGAKLIARSGSSVQEVFVITSKPELLRALVERLMSD